MSYVREHFDGVSLPSPWSALTAATGSITMTDHGVQGALAANGDAAAIYRSFDHTRDAIYWYCAAAKYTGSSLTPWPAMRLMHSASAPVAGTRATFNILAQHTYYSPGVTYDRINWSISPTGTNQQWQESSQSWATGGSVISMPAEAPDTDYRIYGMQWDATNSRVRWMAAHTVSGSSENPDYGPKIVTLTDWVSLSSILNGTSSTLWLVLGWPETNFWIGAGSFHIEWFSEQYGADIDVYCNGKASIGGTYNITHHHGHDLRAGMFVPGTRAQIAIDKGTAGQWDDNKTQWGSAILADDGNYVQSYNGDAGGSALQIGIATATSPYGPWTKYASNPVIATGIGGSDYEQYTRFNVLVEDWLESDSAKRYKLIVNMADAGGTTRTGLFYASAYTGPYTYDGRLLEDDGTETGIAYRGQPIYYNGLWHLFYNANVGGVNTIRYATGSTLRAGAMTKANVTLSTEGANAVELTLTGVSGRTWTCADTTGLVKDMFLVCTQTSSGDTYDTTRVRKVIDATTFEVYHTCAGATTGTVVRSANYGTDNALNHVINIGGTWHFIMTTFKAFTSHPSYSAHHEWNSLFVGGSSPYDASAIDWFASPIAPMGRDAWNTTISNENVRVLTTPIRFAQGGGTLALALGLAGAGTVASSGITGAGTLPLTIGLAGSGGVQVSGSGALPLSLGLAGVGGVQVSGAGALALPLGLSGTGTVPRTGTGTLALTLGLAGAGAVGSVPVSGTGTLALTLAMAGAGTVAVAGSGTMALTLALGGAGRVEVRGAGTIPLTISLAGTGAIGSVPIAGSGVLALGLGLGGVGTVLVSGGGSLSLALGLVGAGTVPRTGSGALPLLLQLAGVGTVVTGAPYAGMIRLTSQRGPARAFYPSNGAALRFTPIEPSS